MQARWYRAPEVILGCRWGPKIDCWGLGTTNFEVCIGAPPFAFSSPELILAAQEAVCGPFPASMLTHPIVLQYLMPGGHAYEVDPPGQPAGVYNLTASPDSSL